ncbi:cation efflux family-domain-containing protein [Phellopilus nigrolimitatus]|nr:cation efflux family-domain-containing protein [Phellopilus nigrolimitatus]
MSAALTNRSHSTSSKAKGKGSEKQEGEEKDDSDHSDHSHSHSHSLFGGHSHAHGEDGAGIVQALEGTGDRGSRITVIGLVVNVALTASKGAAGWYMNSAALLAEAGHSASDLLGDFVTLGAWRLSRRAPTERFPYGFGKVETLGTAALALILVGGALGIGVHALALLAHHLGDTAATLPPGGPAHVLVQNVSAAAQAAAAHAPLPAHAHAHTLDPNAAWFALASVLAKEWLFRATRRVAHAENSRVLYANAVHHRADAYSSGVALAAILGTWVLPALPLDPLGGLLVAALVLRSGLQLGAGALAGLADAGVGPATRDALQGALRPLVEEERGVLRKVDDLRAVRAGALLFVDVRVRVPRALPVGDAVALEARIDSALRAVRKELAEVRVKFVPADEEERSEEEVEETEKEGQS